MSFPVAMLLVAVVALLWSVALAWRFIRSVEQTMNEFIVQQRLMKHSARVGQGGPMPEGTTLEDLDKGPRTVTLPGTKCAVLVREAHPCLTEEQNKLRSEVLQDVEDVLAGKAPEADATLAEHYKRSLRYTGGHRREAKRLRALEAEQAKVEAGEPKSNRKDWKPPLDDTLTPCSKLSRSPKEQAEPTVEGGIAVGGK